MNNEGCGIRKQSDSDQTWGPYNLNFKDPTQGQMGSSFLDGTENSRAGLQTGETAGSQPGLDTVVGGAEGLQQRIQTRLVLIPVLRQSAPIPTGQQG